MKLSQLPPLASLFLLVRTCASHAQPRRVPFNGETYAGKTVGGAYFSDIDGPWPSVFLEVGDPPGYLYCYVTLWPESIFIAQRHCVEELTTNVSGVLCSDKLSLAPFYTGQLTAVDDGPVNITTWREQVGGYDYNASSRGFTNEDDDDLFDDGAADLLQDLHADGLGYQAQGRVALWGDGANSSIVVAENFSQTPSNLSATFPVLTSYLSLWGGNMNDAMYPYLYNNSIVSLYEQDDTPSKSFGIHVGSISPYQPGSLYLGGYDRNRILGNFSVYRNDPLTDSTQLYINKISIGVERGYLPLKSLAAANGSYVRGPWSIEPPAEYSDLSSTPGAYGLRVTIEPGLSYMYLPRQICDSLAIPLGLTYSEAHNLYFWNISSSDALFKSPAYLEIQVGVNSGKTDDFQLPTINTIKIPLALLHNTFHATVRARNGTLVFPGRYFPCSPYDTYDVETEWIRTAALGRAFLQGALFGMEFHSNMQFLAQAPGPTGIPKDDSPIAIDADKNLTSINQEVPMGTWTHTWRGDLPAWTRNLDGTILDLDPEDDPSGMSEKEKIGIGVGTTFGTILAAVLTWVFSRMIISSARRTKQRHRDMQKENEVARKTEAEEFERESLLPSMNEDPESPKQPQNRADEIHRIPRKPVGTAAPVSTGWEETTSSLIWQISASDQARSTMEHLDS